MAVGNWIAIPVHWNGLLAYLEQIQGTRLHSDIIRLVFAATIYKIQEARNSKTHRNTLPHSFVILNEIIALVKAQLSISTKFQRAAQKSHVYHNWL